MTDLRVQVRSVVFPIVKTAFRRKSDEIPSIRKRTEMPEKSLRVALFEPLVDLPIVRLPVFRFSRVGLSADSVKGRIFDVKFQKMVLIPLMR